MTSPLVHYLTLDSLDADFAVYVNQYDGTKATVTRETYDSLERPGTVLLAVGGDVDGWRYTDDWDAR